MCKYKRLEPCWLNFAVCIVESGVTRHTVTSNSIAMHVPQPFKLRADSLGEALPGRLFIQQDPVVSAERTASKAVPHAE